jgi:mannose-6-phosphate isomerase
MAKQDFSSPMFFQRNRVFRVYEGGKLFHDFLGDDPVDSNYPEEWIASKVEALNGTEGVPNEGLSKIEGEDTTFSSLLNAYPCEMTGDLGFDILVKILDSAVRLPVQTHPDPEFSGRHLGSAHGKTECWVILATRPGAKLYFGFKEGVTEKDLQDSVERSEQPGDAFSSLLQEVEAMAGDVWLIPARVAHAIGAGCLILEVQEPTDFTIQPERWCDKYRLSDHDMYLGLSKDVALSCFDLQKAGKAVLTQGRKRPQVTYESTGFRKEVLVSFDDTPCFAVNRYNVFTECTLKNLAVYVVTKGEGSLISSSTSRQLRIGSYFFVPYAAKRVSVRTGTEIELIECLPPSQTVVNRV